MKETERQSDESSAIPSEPLRQGPLRGLRAVEFAGVGPAPFAAMVLADMGVDVVCIDRPDASPCDTRDVVRRGRRIVRLDLKSAAAIATALDLLANADVLIEGFRPGVMERLGLGPDVVLARNPRIIYGRMTGWGQTGPLAHAAGHDINYISIPGALAAIGPADGKPIPPLNLVGDYGGGALYLLLGILAAVHERSQSGRGQVVDCAMVDGVASLLTPLVSMVARGTWRECRGSNMLDGGAPFYTTYECADGEYLSVGALEPKFYALLCQLAGLDAPEFREQWNESQWPAAHMKAAEIFKRKSREEWCRLLEGTDACCSPVLGLSEAANHPHVIARQIFVEVQGVSQPAPAPRFSRTPSAIHSPPPTRHSDAEVIVSEWERRPAQR